MEDIAYFDHLEKRHINESQLMKIIIRPYQVVKYREERWGPFANSLYLKHKERFDLVTYNRLESENADIMQEVYFRLKDGEESWESLAKQFPGAGTDATAVQEAIPISQVEPEIVDVLRKVEPRRVARPIQLSNKVTVVSLIEFKSSKFDNEIRTKLLRQEFEDWLEQECNRMMNKVRFPNTETMTGYKSVEFLQQVEFTNAKSETLQEIAKEADLICLRQGQTLLRANTLETNCFVVVEGALRLLAKEPFNDDLFSVGRAEAYDLIGVVGLLRQSACEGAIARRPSKLLSIPIELINELRKRDSGLTEGLSKHCSPCEGAAVLREYLQKRPQPPSDACNWVLDQLKSSESAASEAEKLTKLLSTSVSKYEEFVGTVITESQIEEIETESTLPIRFWYWNKSETVEEETGNNKQYWNRGKSKMESSDDENIKEWSPSSNLDLSRLGLKDASNQSDVQGFRIIKGKGPVGANLATLRMLSRAYNTPCPVDVIEKVLEGASERSPQIPIHTIGQLAETMGLQTQVGTVKVNQIHRLELPVIITDDKNYSLLTDVDNEKILIANPERGWVDVPFEEARKKWGEDVKVVLIKRLDNTPSKQFGWSWFAPVVKGFSATNSSITCIAFYSIISTRKPSATATDYR